MAEHSTADAFFTSADGTWSVVSTAGRLALSDGASNVLVPVEGPLRWERDGEELSFAEALADVPADLHGWMALAAVVALRQCLGGLILAVALPPGEQDWCGLAERSGPLAAWMNGLGGLEGIDVPALPDGVDDGFGDRALGPRR
jgi:hypothetical protein